MTKDVYKRQILYGAFRLVEKTTGEEAMAVFNQALENIMPILETRSRRIGGQNYQVPTEVRPERKEVLGLRWLVQYARLRHEKTMEERLAKEIIDASKGTGAAEMCIRDRSKANNKHFGLVMPK